MLCVRSLSAVVGTQALKTDVIFREGERADSMYVIEQGAVELSRHAVVLTHLDQGAAFGEDSLVGRQHIGRAGEEEGGRVEEHQIKRVRSATIMMLLSSLSWWFDQNDPRMHPIARRSARPLWSFLSAWNASEASGRNKRAAIRSGRRRRCRSATSS